MPLRGALNALLHPPSPPFIVGLPLYGIRHGGENHLRRTVWWDEDDGHPLIHETPLVRLQSKHVALYATIAQDARVYPLQVDDAHEVMVDVGLWREMREQASALAAEMVAAGVWPEKIRSTLLSLSPPPRFRIGHAAWEERVAPFRKHHRSFWWSVFVAILPIEETKTNAKPRSI